MLLLFTCFVSGVSDCIWSRLQFGFADRCFGCVWMGCCVDCVFLLVILCLFNSNGILIVGVYGCCCLLGYWWRFYWCVLLMVLGFVLFV